jgi:hypothetical protein
MQELRDISPTILAILFFLVIGGGVTGALAYALDGYAELLAIGGLWGLVIFTGIFLD